MPGGRVSAVPVRRDLLPERRSAALIVYLALEGPTARSRLAGLLWPDSTETTARNNLSQTLRRLRQSGQAALIGDDPLQLDGSLDEDDALALLRPHDYDDLPDFDDWRLAAQERRRSARVAALRAEATTREAAGEWRAALDLTEVWLDLDPVSEVAHRQLMRLHHLVGDRAGALTAYHRCQAVLRRELGLGPGPETVALAREVERSVVPVLTAWALPLSVQRPPRLVGRVAAWQAMERAWAEGKGVILSGEPGVGKTRLMRDFMAAHGQRVFFEARPGDRQLPYSTHARTFAALLRQFPDLALPDWVRRELARIVPGLGELPPPIASDADKLRFYQAKTEVLRLAAAAGMGALAFDDLQFIDAASAEAGEYTLSEFWGEAHTRLRTIHAFRTDELTPDVQARLDGLVAAGLSVHVELSPLSPPEVDELLDSLELPEVQGQALSIARAAGGNPLVVLESVRHVLGQQEVGLPSGRLSILLGERLARLSPAALSLARTGAVLGADFGPEMAASMLDQSPLDLTPAWQELEAAQVLRGSAFTHDLLAEGVLGGLPGPLGALLHRRAAAALEPSGHAPARIAGHWEAGGEPQRAAAWWLRAGEEAQAHYRFPEAADLYERAWNTSDQPPEAFNAGLKLARLLGEGEPDTRLQAVVARLLAQARIPAEHAAAHAAQCQLLGLRGEGAALEEVARNGLTWAAQDPGQGSQVELLSYLGTGLFFQRRLEDALAVFRETTDLAEQQQNLHELSIAVDNMATVLGHLNRRQEALEPLRRVERQLAQAGLVSQRAAVLVGLGNIERFCGRQRSAMAILDQAGLLLERVGGAGYVKQLCALGRVICARLLERYALALQLCEEALRLGHEASVMRPLLYKEQAHLYLLLGADTSAARSLAQTRVGRAEGQDAYPDVVAIQQQVIEALLNVRRGGSASVALAHLQAEAEQRQAPLSDRVASVLTLAPWLPPAQRLALTEEMAEEARRTELFGLWLAVCVDRAQAYVALDQLDAAEAALREVLQADPALSPACSRAEVLFTQARLLARQRDPSAPATLRAARAALLQVADEQVPPEFRATFLALPLHLELLAESDPQRPRWRPLSDAQWASVEDVFAGGSSGTGRPRRDTRAVLDGVRWALATGAAWNRPFPAHLPSAATCYRRYREWQAGGLLAEVQRRLGG